MTPQAKEPRVLVSAPSSASRGRRAGIAIALIAALLLAVTLIALIGGRSPTTTTPGPVVAGPTRIADVPTKGFSHDHDGAVRAAVAYADAFGTQEVINPSRFADVVDAIATPQLAAQMRAQEADAQKAAGTRQLQAAAKRGGVFAQSMPLAYRVRSYRPDRAVVDLWELSVLTGGSVEPFARFSRSRSTLTWTGGEWKLARLGRPLGGPTPAIERGAATNSSRTFIRSLRRYRELHSAP